jgi:hypothetical protein
VSAYCVRLAKKLRSDNPQLDWEMGAKHLKLLVGGRVVGVLSKSMRRKDFGNDMRVQLRQRGLKVS